MRLAETYFDIADDLLKDEAKRRDAYEAGAEAAKQAYELDDAHADAHFFHAVNMGSAERLKGLANAAMVVKEMKRWPVSAAIVLFGSGLGLLGLAGRRQRR